VVSATFHGRDLFTPAAAHLALGVPMESIGPPIDPASLAKLDWPQATIGDGELETTVVYVDTFGNVKLSGVTADLLAALPDLELGDRVAVGDFEVPWVRTFGDVTAGELLLYEDSYGRLCLAQNQGNAAQRLDISESATVRISRAAQGKRQAAE
jgi:S-adenosylmethionine hydrolase